MYASTDVSSPKDMGGITSDYITTVMLRAAGF